MRESLTIARKPVLRKSQDYEFLRSEGLRHIERLGHEVWTDFNVHDPGIALLELFCYAISELGYRTGYDIRDLLTRSVNGVPESTADFHPSQEILTCNPVSFDDLRKLLIDITGVRNAWLTINRDVKYYLDRDNALIDTGVNADFEEKALNGLYDVSIEFEEFVVDKTRTHRVGLSSHRNLTSDFVLPGGGGMSFNVQHALSIDSVAVYPEAAGAVRIRLVDRQGAELGLVKHTVSAAAVGSKTRIDLGFHVPAGQGYRLEARGSVPLRRIKAANLANAYPYSIDHVLHVTGGFSGGLSRGDYLFLFDWHVSYAVPPLAGFRPTTLAVTSGPAKTGGAHVDASGRGLELVAQRNMMLAAFAIDAQGAGEVTVRLRPLPGGAPMRFTAAVDKGSNILEPQGFEMKGGRRYRLEVTGASTRLWESSGVTYPLVVDNVVEVQGPFPGPAPAGGGTAGVAILYDLSFEYPSQPHPLNITRDDVRAAVLHRIHTTRNLCEDTMDVCPLLVEEVAVCSDIEVAADADIDEVLAEMFYRLGLHVSPAVKFYSLDQMLARGKQPDEIFEGPLLDHGFIDDDEFGAIKRRCEIRTSDVVQIIMDVAGVDTIKTISLLSFYEGRPLLQEDWLLPLSAPGRIPGFTADRSKVVFYRNGLPVFANRDRVAKILKDKKAADLQTKLKGYQTAVPIPVGEDRRVETHFSAQNELPMNFMVGRHRVPKSETPLRKAQSLQLKAYLMLFEQLLANHLSQLANVPLLFSWRAGDHPTYFTQPVFDFAEYDVVYSLDGIIATLEAGGGAAPAGAARKEKIDAGLRPALEHIVETEEIRIDRRNRFLDHLLARFNEDVTEYGALMQSLRGHRGLEEIIDHKRTLVAEYPVLSARRGAAYDYRFPGDAANIAGFKRRMYRLLGIDSVATATFADAGISIAKVGVNPDEYRFEMGKDPADPTSPTIFESMTCEHSTAIEALLDAVIEYGADEDNYVGRQLRWHCAGDPQHSVLGTVKPGSSKAAVAARFATLRVAEGFHLIEHILLRKRTTNDAVMAVQLNAPGECECVEVTDPYSFRASIVLPAWPDRFRRTRFRRFIEHTLREQAPAHVFLKICWISHQQMRELEGCLTDWRMRLGHIAPDLGVCPAEVTHKPLTGRPMPPPINGPVLPPTAPAHTDYRNSLADLVDKLESMINVYPLATLYDCEQDDDKHKSDKPPVTLNNTNLGTF